MKYITVKEMAELWGISERRIIKLCNTNRIDGAYKNGMIWNIPENAKKPIDQRTSYSDLEQGKKTIVIAGINSEIGKALTNILQESNYKVIGLYQKNSKIDQGLIDTNITLKEVDYFDRNNLLDVTSTIKEDLAGFVFMEIFFGLEDALKFDYDGFEDSYKVNVFAMNLLVRELVKKMNFESSIVIVNSIEALRGSFGASAYASAQAAKMNLVQTFANIFTEMYGIRINSLMAGWIGGVMEDDSSFNKATATIPMKRLGNPDEIADDIFLLLTRHKYTTGSFLISDGGYLAVDEQSKTEDLDSGKFYRILDKFFNETKKGSKIWIVSTMMENEWNVGALERKFIQSNFEAVERGVEIHWLYVFAKNKIKEYKNNSYIQMFLSCKNIKTSFIDLDELKVKNPKLLEIVANGWNGIDDSVLLVDLPSDGTSRGYVTMNKREINKAKKCFEELECYAVALKKIIK